MISSIRTQNILFYILPQFWMILNQTVIVQCWTEFTLHYFLFSFILLHYYYVCYLQPRNEHMIAVQLFICFDFSFMWFLLFSENMPILTSDYSDYWILFDSNTFNIQVPFSTPNECES